MGLLLTYLPTEAEAYCALSLLMRGRGLREMFLPDMSVLQIRLWQLSKLLPPRLAAHLEAHAVLPVLYVSGLVCRGSAGGCGRPQGKLCRLGRRRCPLQRGARLAGMCSHAACRAHVATSCHRCCRLPCRPRRG